MNGAHHPQKSGLGIETMNLFECTVPVFQRYLNQLTRLYDALEEQQADPDLRLVSDGFCAGEHFAIAQGFCLRTVYPVLGQSVPELPNEGAQFADLRICNHFVRDHLAELAPSEFETADAITVQHVAGQARLSHAAHDYALLFGLPNFFFHVVSGYSTFRMHGFDLGKAEFDGFHTYEKGFQFS
jgi:hypothetical protein